jgi:hypothetical protein
MKRVLQLSVLLVAVAVMVAVTPASQLPSHFNAALLAAQASPTLVVQAQDPAQQPQSTQPQSQPAQNPDQMQQDPNQANPPGQRLPKTASPLPAIALIGFVSLGAIFVIRRISRTVQ